MFEIRIPAIGYEKTPQTVVNGKPVEDKVVPVIFHPLNRSLGAGIQASRCTACGTAGCFQGAGHTSTGKVDVGCPFEREIPDIHKDLDAAEKVAAQAFNLIQELAPDTANKLEAEFKAQGKTVSSKLSAYNSEFPVRVFEVLSEFNTAAANKAQTLFDDHLKKAWQRSKAKGPMGDIYGRICPESLCQRTCTLSNDQRYARLGAVTINRNEAALWDYAWVRGWMDNLNIEHDRPETVLVFGSGFAGYAAAERLREQYGYQVIMVEKNHAAGEPGHNQILQYKVHQQRFERYYDRLRNSGVQIVTMTEAGANGKSVRELAEQYNARAIILASGAPVPKMNLRLKGDAVDRVIPSTAYLAEQQRAIYYDLPANGIAANLNGTGKVIAVIGTGDTAVDLARVAEIQGAKEIILISRRDEIKAREEDAAAYETMMSRAAQSGMKVTVQFYMSPTELNALPDGRMVLKGKNTKPGAEDPTIELAVDMVMTAISTETGHLPKIYGISNLPIFNTGSLKVIPTPERIATKTRSMDVGSGYSGRLDGLVDVFAAGQVIREGSSLAAIAGRDGFDAADWVHEAIENREAFDEEIRKATGHAPLELNYGT